MGGVMANQALDIPQRQVLVDFFNDPAFHWHARVLLIAAPTTGSWVCVTPDDDIEFIDLTQHRVIPLERGADLPAQHTGNMYVFDKPTPQQVASLEQRGKLLAETFGISLSPGSVDGTWLVSDVANPSFGQEIPGEAMADAETFVARDRVGCVRIEDEWVTCE